MLDFLLNRALFYILDNRVYDASNLITLEDSTFDINLKWLVNQQNQDGYWPPVSTKFLNFVLENDKYRQYFTKYFSKINLPKGARSPETLEEALDKHKLKTVSYVNTIETMVLLSKYFYIKQLIDIFSN